MPPNEPMVKGRADIQARLQREFKEGVKLQLTPTESSISGSQAFEAGTATVTLPGGGQRALPGGANIAVPVGSK